jgi:thiol-disulfide isomerase/thioredoxin/mono/diheme cytochrome c family protein
MRVVEILVARRTATDRPPPEQQLPATTAPAEPILSAPLQCSNAVGRPLPEGILSFNVYRRFSRLGALQRLNVGLGDCRRSRHRGGKPRFRGNFLAFLRNIAASAANNTSRVQFPETQEIDVRNLIWAGMFVASGLVPAATFAVEDLPVNPSPSPGSPPAIGARIEGIAARDVHGNPWSLAEVGREKVVVLAFLGTECPLVKAYVPRLVELARKYEPKGVVFLGIDPNRQDSHTELSAFVRTNQIPFAVAKDLKQHIADAVGATRTPEVVVLDRERRLRYRGRIDDQFGFIPTNKAAAYHRPKPAQNDLAAALDAVLAGTPVAHPETTASGCLIGRDRPANPQSRVTYANQVSRLLNQRCVVCHRAGQIAPFALTSYEEAAGWADMMNEVVQSGRMPPWGADARIGKFRNEGRLSDAERQILAQWAADGAPEGNPQDIPEAPKFAAGWMIPKPDEILYMQDKPFEVPAKGVVEYQFFPVDPGWKEDRWISAIEALPGNPAVVHHILILVVPPGGTLQGLGGDDDFLAAYAPGARPEPLPAGMARRVKAGSKLVFQMHYTPNGTRQTDRSSVGIKFAEPQKVQKEVVVSSAINAVFQIPAGAADQEVDSRYIFKRDSLLLSLMPHMHLRGKDFMYEAVYPDGRHETLLSVPRYDFGWQTTYRLNEPKPMPQGTVLQCVAHYDNSADNLNNPDPNVTVGWGDQTFDEMMIGFFEAAPVDENLTKAHWPKRLTRLEQFDVIMRASKGEPDENVKVAAYLALKDQEWMTRFGFILTLMVPQVDRVCVTSIENGQVKQINGPFPSLSKKKAQPVPEDLRSPLPQSAAETEPLAKGIAGAEPIVHQDLTKVEGPIFAAMVRRGARSSLHVPVTIRGKKVSVNYWSRDLSAFPPPAVAILTGLTKVMASAQSDQKKVTQQ